MDYSEKWGNSVDEAVELALKYCREKGKSTQILTIREHARMYIIYTGIPGVRKVGNAGIAVSRENGSIASFVLPKKENFAILHESREIPADEWPTVDGSNPA